MRILVAGGRGLVGGLVRRAAVSRHDVHALGRSELDIENEASIRDTLGRLSPDVVINCAAFTDVDGAELTPERAFAVNAEGAGKLAAAAATAGAFFAHVSTDYVFDGRAREPYREEDPTGPLSSYGASKLEGEKRVAASHPEGHAIVRTAWIYGPGKGFVDWARGRLERGEELPLIEDQVGSPTNAALLAAALVRLAAGRHRGLFHYVSSGATTWLELGRWLARELRIESPNIRAILASELGRPAQRPAYSVLSTARYETVTKERVPTWEEALRQHLASQRNGDCPL